MLLRYCLYPSSVWFSAWENQTTTLTVRASHLKMAAAFVRPSRAGGKLYHKIIVCFQKDIASVGLLSVPRVAACSILFFSHPDKLYCRKIRRFIITFQELCENVSSFVDITWPRNLSKQTQSCYELQLHDQGTIGRPLAITVHDKEMRFERSTLTMIQAVL